MSRPKSLDTTLDACLNAFQVWKRKNRSKRKWGINRKELAIQEVVDSNAPNCPGRSVSTVERHYDEHLKRVRKVEEIQNEFPTDYGPDLLCDGTGEEKYITVTGDGHETIFSYDEFGKKIIHSK